MTNEESGLSDEQVQLLASILTEHSQVQRSVRNHDRAEEIEELRNDIYQQHAGLL